MSKPVVTSLPNPLGMLFGEDRYFINPLSYNFPLMDVRFAVVISLAYIVVTYLLVQFMKNREALDLFYFRVFHNAFLVLLSGYMTIGILYEAFINKYSFFCNNGTSPEADRPMAFLIWVFYVSKIYEFLDTVIMALRKKNNQITVLHVYHHFSIFLIWWMNVYYIPYGDAYFAPAYNAFVHVLMYSYYLMTSFHIPCPWKSFITKFQIGQFVFFVVQGGYQLFTPGCFELRELTAINFFYALSLLALFVDFYINTYMKRPRPVKGDGPKKSKRKEQ
mmetsp:Transcript_20499/g.28300  ORF Transcript_20499/g.28300 Transcript_20499/m.28300 type:complete len:276 (-) Transcript_20499:59-886(-)|eukprot:CAMPEP_0201488048 /NCGR_PEP_ID=MMETSP0151_2-20130828/16564_1 /ASSEMBLY_ACC=CAM_ASM_000257 /TAXON_ID=200890 /ORGANISM="Paramoeba atlantica, Strain 621/1 / CCAP 1560/9" /LENGTH=275 /DNA_ID=CAMNT_0047873259 /DNA_START=114 /DNA_END=941 /DNA_ORIENTATION=+